MSPVERLRRHSEEARQDFVEVRRDSRRELVSLLEDDDGYSL